MNEVESSPVVARFRDVSFAYEKHAKVLDSVSFELRRGEIASFVGPSGCGKSTVLSLMAGLISPTQGLVVAPGRTSKRRDGQHPLAMMFQKDTLLPWLTVRQNSDLYGRFNKLGSDARRRRTAFLDHLISVAGLAGTEDLYPHQLSGGMRRRVAFLAAVSARPDLLLLDEPFSALDEPTRIAIHQVIFDIARELGTTVVLVTHDLAEAVTLSDRVLVLTRRPARVFSEHEIPFGSARDMMDMRMTDTYANLYAALWADLGKQIAGTESPPSSRSDITEVVSEAADG